MRVVIDQSICTGNGRCYTLVPELFTDDERGYGQVVGDGVLTDDQVEQAQKAVVACPERAITLEE